MSDLKRCPYCNALIIGRNAVICVNCGKHLQTGKQLNSKIKGKSLLSKLAGVARKTIILGILLCLFAGAVAGAFWGYKVFKEEKHSNAKKPQNVDFASSEQKLAASPVKSGVKSFFRKVKQTFGQSSLKPAKDKNKYASGEEVKETFERDDPKAKLDILNRIAYWDIGFLQNTTGYLATDWLPVLSGKIEFKPHQEVPLRVKLYRSASKDGDYVLVYNELLDKFSSYAESYGSMVARREAFYNRIEKNKHRMSKQALENLKRSRARLKMMNSRVRMSKSSSYKNKLTFRIEDSDAVKCNVNNVFYKIKICSSDGNILKLVEPQKVPLVPFIKFSNDFKSWYWSPFYPGKDPVDGSITQGLTPPYKMFPMNSKKVSGKLDEAKLRSFLKGRNLKKSNIQKYLKTVFAHEFRFNVQWPSRLIGSPSGTKSGVQTVRNLKKFYGNRTYSRHLNASQAATVIPIFADKSYLDYNGDVQILNLKVNGFKVNPMYSNIYYSLRKRVNGKMETVLHEKKMPYLNYPGGMEYECVFKYKNNKNILKFPAPLTPSGLKAKLCAEGVKLSWDKLNFSEKTFLKLPVILIYRNDILIKKMDTMHCSWVDRSVEKGKLYQYSLALNDGVMNLPCWQADKGVFVSQTDLGKIKDPFPALWDSTVYIPESSLKTRPLRISVWEPDLCHAETSEPGVKLFNAAIDILQKRKDAFLIDRRHRKEIVTEKALTMSYEKNLSLRAIPADFSLLVRSFSGIKGNGVELWLVQSRIIPSDNPKISFYPYYQNIFANDIPAWRIGSILIGGNDISGEIKTICRNLNKKLEERIFFKQGIITEKLITPVKFVFMDLKPLRQAVKVSQSKAIGESIMLELSNYLDDVEVMSRNEWQAVHAEQQFMRNQGEEFEKDISGSVLISGFVWEENGKRNYCFYGTGIRDGSCLGSVTCSGDLKAVANKLAKWCRSLKISPNTFPFEGRFVKAALEREQRVEARMKTRFNAYEIKQEKTAAYDTRLTKEQFVAKMEEMGNIHSAVGIYEREWEKQKTLKAGLTLMKHYHRLGMYKKELELIIKLLGMKGANSRLLTSYNHARICYNSGIKSKYLNNTGTGKSKQEGGNCKQTAVKYQKKKIRFSETFDFNTKYDKMLYEGIARIAPEWNPGGKIMTPFWRSVFHRDLEYCKTLPMVNKYGVWFSGWEFHNKTDAVTTYFAALRLRYIPLFDAKTPPLSRSVYLWNQDKLAREIAHFDKKFSPVFEYPEVRALFEMAEQPDLKILSLKAPRNIGDFWSKKQYQQYQERFSCDTTGKYLEYEFKLIYEQYFQNAKLGFSLVDLKLPQLMIIHFMAVKGNYNARKIINVIMSSVIPKDWKKYLACSNKRSLSFPVMYYRAYRGDNCAIDFIAKYYERTALGPDSDNEKRDLYFLMSKSGCKKVLEAMFRKDKTAYGNLIYATDVRWGNKKVIETLVRTRPEIFKKTLYYYLLEGFGFKNCELALLNKARARGDDTGNPVICAGKPLCELYKEIASKSIKGEE